MFPPTRPVRPAAMKTGSGDLQKATPPEIQGHPSVLGGPRRGSAPLGTPGRGLSHALGAPTPTKVGPVEPHAGWPSIGLSKDPVLKAFSFSPYSPVPPPLGCPLWVISSPPTRPVRPAAMKTGRGDLQKATPPEIQGHPSVLGGPRRGSAPFGTHGRGLSHALYPYAQESRTCGTTCWMASIGL